MSANNIVIIKKEEDGKFRGYHRDYDAYYEGQYREREEPIFEANTIEEAVHAYNKWCQETMFTVEYGYEFQDLDLFS